MSQNDDRGVRCQDGCGSKADDMQQAEAQGWEFLVISKRYRCPACRQALDLVNHPERTYAIAV